jgi:hypothetical protein
MEDETPRKALYQIYVSEKATDKLIQYIAVVAYSEPEAIVKAKVGSFIAEAGLTRADVDFYIRTVGILYGDDTFAEPLSLAPPLMVNELPLSTVSATVISIASDKLSCIVERIFNGKPFQFKSLLTSATADKIGKPQGINVGDTVMVTYLDHAPIGTLPIIVDKIAATVYP